MNDDIKKNTEYNSEGVSSEIQVTEESTVWASSDEATEPLDFTEKSSQSELDLFESAEIEDIEELAPEKIISVLESLLFATDKPMSLSALKAAFSGTKVRTADLRHALQKMTLDYQDAHRGVELVEVAQGYQIRTKAENATYLQRTVKARPFKLSGPALEVLSIVAYKQPCTKSQVDEIRGVESGHLMRGLLDRGLIHFGEKSELPGRPMFYVTSKKFLEIFGLRHINELPSLAEIDQLIPEGMEPPAEKKPHQNLQLSDLTGELSKPLEETYSKGESELLSISSELETIQLSTEFFEEEKRRQKAQKEAEKAQDIKERLLLGEEVSARESSWLEKYEAGTNPQDVSQVAESLSFEPVKVDVEAQPRAPKNQPTA